MAKYDMQVLVGVGLGILILMGISDSKKRAKQEEEDGTEEPRPPSEFEVELKAGQDLIGSFSREIQPSMNELTGKMSLDRAKDIESHRVNRIEEWRAAAAHWMTRNAERFALLNQIEIVRDISNRQNHVDNWFREMAGKEKTAGQPVEHRSYHLTQNAFMADRAPGMFEDDDDAIAQRKIGSGMDVYPNDFWRDGNFDAKARQNSAGHMTGMDLDAIEENFGRGGAAADWDKTTETAKRLFGEQAATQPLIEFAGFAQKDNDPLMKKNEFDVTTNDKKNASNIGEIPSLEQAYGGHDPQVADRSTNDPIDNFSQPGQPPVNKKPTSIRPRPPADDGPIRDGTAAQKRARVGQLTPIDEIRNLNGAAGVSPDINGDGAEPVFDVLTGKAPGGAGQQYAMYNREGQYQGTVTRAEIEKQITIGIRQLGRKVGTYDEGMVQYRKGIAGLAEINRLIAQNETGEGTAVLTPQEIREMTTKFQTALSEFSRASVAQFSRKSYAGVYQDEQKAAASTEQTPLRKDGAGSPRKKRKGDDAFFGSKPLAGTNQGILEDLLNDPKIQHDFTTPNRRRVLAI